MIDLLVIHSYVDAKFKAKSRISRDERTNTPEMIGKLGRVDSKVAKLTGVSLYVVYWLVVDQPL